MQILFPASVFLIADGNMAYIGIEGQSLSRPGRGFGRISRSGAGNVCSVICRERYIKPSGNCEALTKFANVSFALGVPSLLLKQLALVAQ